jgi:hypothetical protein
MKTIMFFTMLFCSSLLTAQTNTSTSLLEESISIKLAKFPIADFPNKSVPVSDIRIAQMVRDSVNLGYALKGMDNYVVNLKITKPLTDFLQDHIYRMYEDDFKKDGIKMFWVLKDLRMGEKTSFMEYSYCRFNMDGYISTSGVLYKKVCTLDTVYVTESGGDVSRWHGDEIEKGFGFFSKRVLRFTKSVLADNSEQKTIEEILSQSYQNTDHPILKDTIYNEGAYLNFEEFLQNKPSIQNYEPVIIGKHNIKFTKINSQGFSDTLNIWGLCKSTEIYRYYGETLIPIEKMGTGFIISDFVKNSNKHNRNLVFFSLMGGLAGGVIGGTAVSLAASAAKNKLMLVKSIPYITKPAKQPVASCIDMKTGEFSF